MVAGGGYGEALVDEVAPVVKIEVVSVASTGTSGVDGHLIYLAVGVVLVDYLLDGLGLGVLGCYGYV